MILRGPLASKIYRLGLGEEGRPGGWDKFAFQQQLTRNVLSEEWRGTFLSWGLEPIKEEGLWRSVQAVDGILACHIPKQKILEINQSPGTGSLSQADSISLVCDLLRDPPTRGKVSPP